MEDFKADILSPNRKGQFLFYSLAGAILLIVIIMVVFQVIPFIFQLFSLMVWGFIVSRYLLQTKKQVFKKTNGFIRISNSEIYINDSAYKLSEISSLEIFFSGWKSYKRSNDRNRPVTDLHHGDKNVLTIITDKQSVKCEFLLTSKEHWQLLREYVIEWYRTNTKIVEDSEHGKTYGLEVLNYKEIQEFKNMVKPSKAPQL